MSLAYLDYIKLVKEEYERKRMNNELPRFSVQSTRSKLKDECWEVFQNRYNKKDRKALEDFFGKKEDDEQLGRSIRRAEPELFRTLDNYLKGNTDSTLEKNVELLAWLIDFRHRPWSLSMEVNLSEDELLILAKSVNKPVPQFPQPEPVNLPDEEDKKVQDRELETKSIENTEEKKAVAEPVENNPGNIMGAASTGKPFENSTQDSFQDGLIINKWWRKKSVLITLVLLFLTAGSYIVWQTIKDQQGCMYWNGDQYVPVECNAKPPGRKVLPLDVEHMENFQRITQKDTITEWSIGKLYYIKHKNKIEYYTYSGNYPEDLNRFVKRLSRYIFDKDKENRK